MKTLASLADQQLELLLRTLLERALGARVPKTWAGYDEYSVQQRTRYIAALRAFSRTRVAPWATQAMIFNIVSEEDESGTYEQLTRKAESWDKSLVKREERAKAPPSSVARERERLEAERGGLEAWKTFRDRSKVLSTVSEEDAAQSKRAPHMHMAVDSVDPRAQWKPSAEGRVRLYMAVFAAAKDRKSTHKDIWLDGKHIAVKPGGDVMWLAAGFPIRPLLFFYKYLTDPLCQCPLIRSVEISAKEWRRIASGVVSEREKGMLETVSSKALEIHAALVALDGIEKAANDLEHKKKLKEDQAKLVEELKALGARTKLLKEQETVSNREQTQKELAQLELNRQGIIQKKSQIETGLSAKPDGHVNVILEAVKLLLQKKLLEASELPKGLPSEPGAAKVWLGDGKNRNELMAAVQRKFQNELELFESFSALNVDTAYGMNQLGLRLNNEKILKEFEAAVVPDSLVTFGLPSLVSGKLDERDGHFCPISQLESALGMPTEQLVLPDGTGTVLLSMEKTKAGFRKTSEVRDAFNVTLLSLFSELVERCERGFDVLKNKPSGGRGELTLMRVLGQLDSFKDLMGLVQKRQEEAFRRHLESYEVPTRAHESFLAGYEPTARDLKAKGQAQKLRYRQMLRDRGRFLDKVRNHGAAIELAATWIIGLLTANHLTPFEFFQVTPPKQSPKSYDTRGNLVSAVRTESLFSLFFMTQRSRWRETLLALNRQLIALSPKPKSGAKPGEGVGEVKEEVLNRALGYLALAGIDAKDAKSWVKVVAAVEELLSSKSVDDGDVRLVYAVSALFFLYREVFRWSNGVVKMDVQVNTRQADIPRMISAKSQKPQELNPMSFGLGGDDAGPPLPFDAFRSTARYGRQLKPRPLPLSAYQAPPRKPQGKLPLPKPKSGPVDKEGAEEGADRPAREFTVHSFVRDIGLIPQADVDEMLLADLPFAGGISGTTRDYTEHFVASKPQKKPPSPVPQGSLPVAKGNQKAAKGGPKQGESQAHEPVALVVSPQEYWIFQLLNAAFMVSHGYHSFYECMSIAARHPTFGADMQAQIALARKFGGSDDTLNFYSNFLGALHRTVKLPGNPLWVDYLRWRGGEGKAVGSGAMKLSGAFQDVLASMMLIQVLLQPSPDESGSGSPRGSSSSSSKPSPVKSLAQVPAVYQTRSGGLSFRQGASTSSGLNCYLHTLLQLQAGSANAHQVTLEQVRRLRGDWVDAGYVNQHGMIEAGNAGPMRGTTELGLTLQIHMVDGQNRLNHVATVGSGPNVQRALLQYNHFTPLWPV